MKHALKPQIYVANLAAYNHGILEGIWIDAAQDAAQIYDRIDEFLLFSSGTLEGEWAVHDYSDFGELSLGEYPDIEDVAAAGQGIQKHGVAFSIWVNDDNKPDEEAFLDAYSGCYESEQAFVKDLWEQDGTLDRLRKIAFFEHYIDWDAVTRDYFTDSFQAHHAGYQEVHVFWRC